MDLPGEEALKERLGFGQSYAYGVCTKVPGAADAAAWRAETPLPVLQDGHARWSSVTASTSPACRPADPQPDRHDTWRASSASTSRPAATSACPTSIPLDHTGIAAHDGSIYVLGGHGLGPGGAGSTNRAFRYVVAQRTWEELPPMAEARGGQGVAVVGDRIYVVGGRATRTLDRSEPSIGLSRPSTPGRAAGRA